MSKYYALKNLNNYKNHIYFPYFHGLPTKKNNQQENIDAYQKK